MAGRSAKVRVLAIWCMDWPAVAAAVNEKDDDLVQEAQVEHNSAKQLIAQLEQMTPQDDSYQATFKVLGEYVNHHIEEEESRVFDAARQVLTREEERQIGAAFERMKKETAKDGDSMIASTVDLVANMLPPRLTDSFRKTIEQLRAGSRDSQLVPPSSRPLATNSRSSLAGAFHGLRSRIRPAKSFK